MNNKEKFELMMERIISAYKNIVSIAKENDIEMCWEDKCCELFESQNEKSKKYFLSIPHPHIIYRNEDGTYVIHMAAWGVIFDDKAAVIENTTTEQANVKIPITEAELGFDPGKALEEDISVNGIYQLTGRIDDVYNIYSELFAEHVDVFDISDERCRVTFNNGEDNEIICEFVNGPYVFIVSDMKLIEAD